MDGRQLQKVQEALLSAFPNRDELKQFLRFSLNQDLERIADNGNLRSVVYQVIEFAEANGWLDQLIAAVGNARPGNSKIAAIAAEQPAHSAVTERVGGAALEAEEMPSEPSPSPPVPEASTARVDPEDELPAYRDFNLSIQPGPNGTYWAVGHYGNRPPQSSSFESPSTMRELELLRRGFLRATRDLRHLTAGAPPLHTSAARQFGSMLFDRVFKGSLLELLRDALDEADLSGRGLRLRLHLTKVPELLALPWEYLYNPFKRRFFSLYGETPIVRSLDESQEDRRLAVQATLRILVVIANPGSGDYSALDVDAEWAKLKEALADLESAGLVSVERIEGTRETLFDVGHRDDHVLHFIGHGGFDDAGGGGLIVLADKAAPDLMSGERLGDLITGNRSLRLAVLNACQGARTSETNPFAGTAQTLIGKGIPAVVAMQYAITDRAAIRFTREFYRALVRGEPVDAAVCVARRAILGEADEFSDTSPVEWGTPVLYLQSREGRLFSVNRRQDGAQQMKAASRPFELPEGPPNGKIDCNSHFYVQRAADQAVKARLTLPIGCTLVIRSPGHTGGSSLLCVVQQCAQPERFVIALEMTEFNAASRELFYPAFCRRIYRELEQANLVNVSPEPFFDPSLSEISRVTSYLQAVLKLLPCPLVLVLDDLDALCEANLRSEFCKMVRLWHNRRATSAEWKQLTVALVTSLDRVNLIDSSEGIVFNVGEVVELDDFTLNHLADLNRRYGSPLSNKHLQALLDLVNGHPQLAQHALYSVAIGRTSAAELFGSDPHARNPLEECLSPYRRLLFDEPELCHAFKQLLAGRQPTLDLEYRLLSRGLARRTAHEIVPRCELIKSYLQNFPCPALPNIGSTP